MFPLGAEQLAEDRRAGSRLALGCLAAVLIVVAVLLFVFFESGRAMNERMARGKLFETHAQEGHPTVEIWMHGFVDSSFDAYLNEGGKSRLILSGLTCMKGDMGERRNPQARKSPRGASSPAAGPMMYGVYWSEDGRRLVIAFQGFLVAGYDRWTGRQVNFGSDSLREAKSQGRDALLEGFLKGEGVSADELRKLSSQY